MPGLLNGELPKEWTALLQQCREEITFLTKMHDADTLNYEAVFKDLEGFLQVSSLPPSCEPRPS